MADNTQEQQGDQTGVTLLNEQVISHEYKSHDCRTAWCQNTLPPNFLPLPMTHALIGGRMANRQRSLLRFVMDTLKKCMSWVWVDKGAVRNYSPDTSSQRGDGSTFDPLQWSSSPRTGKDWIRDLTCLEMLKVKTSCNV